MPTASGSTARPHHLRAFPGNPTITAPGCVPCREVPGAVRAAPAAAPHPARALQRLPHPYPHPSGGGRSPRPTLRRQLPVSRGELPPTSSAGARRCRAAGSPAATGAARGVRATEAAPRRGGAERCGAERPRGRSGPGQVCAIRTALRRSGVCGGKGGGWGGTAVLPHSGAEKCRFLLHLQFCLAGWLGFLLVVLSEAVLLSVPQEEPEMEPRPPAWPLLCLLLLCQSSCAGEPRALSFCCVFFPIPSAPVLSAAPLPAPNPAPAAMRCRRALL